MIKSVFPLDDVFCVCMTICLLLRRCFFLFPPSKTTHHGVLVGTSEVSPMPLTTSCHLVDRFLLGVSTMPLFSIQSHIQLKALPVGSSTAQVPLNRGVFYGTSKLTFITPNQQRIAFYSQRTTPSVSKSRCTKFRKHFE